MITARNTAEPSICTRATDSRKGRPGPRGAKPSMRMDNDNGQRLPCKNALGTRQEGGGGAYRRQKKAQKLGESNNISRPQYPDFDTFSRVRRVSMRKTITPRHAPLPTVGSMPTSPVQAEAKQEPKANSHFEIRQCKCLPLKSAPRHEYPDLDTFSCVRRVCMRKHRTEAGLSSPGGKHAEEKSSSSDET